MFVYGYLLCARILWIRSIRQCHPWRMPDRTQCGARCCASTQQSHRRPISPCLEKISAVVSRSADPAAQSSGIYTVRLADTGNTVSWTSSRPYLALCPDYIIVLARISVLYCSVCICLLYCLWSISPYEPSRSGVIGPIRPEVPGNSTLPRVKRGSAVPCHNTWVLLAVGLASR